MLRLAVFVACLVVALSQKPSDTPRCCTPDQWEGMEGFVGAYARFIRKGTIHGYASVSYDAKSKKIASLSNATENGKAYTFKIIEDYQNKKLYIINLNQQKCRTVNLYRPFKKACIPANAQRYASYYIGAGVNKLNTVGYHLKQKLNHGVVDAFISVTKKGCIPVGEILTGKIKGAYFMDNIGFINIKTEIRDPSVFTPPKICDKNHDETSWEIQNSYLYREFRIMGI